jgi:hypothetical protein
MKAKILILVFFILFGYVSLSFSLEQDTHGALNQYIAEHTINGFSLDAYLKTTLGFSKGKDEPIKNQKVHGWLNKGGNNEDVLLIRSRHHFHNPLKPWDQSGLTDFGSLDSIGFTPMSSVMWAQDQSDRRWIDFGGDWSWKKARSYFYTGLTGQDYSGNVIAADKTQRDAYFAKTFQAVGQIMHLVQDASVPAHVRNDGHIS